MKKTKWIDGAVKPTMRGVYQRDYRNAHGDRSEGTFSHWNGEYWGLYGVNEDDAARWGSHSSLYQSLPWRGLAQDPNKLAEK